MLNNDPNNYFADEGTKLLYRNLLSFLESHDQNGREVVAFTLLDGSHRFSFTDSLDVLINISTESLFSDRLWVIVSVAYLEDQIRTLLENFLTNDEVSHDLLDPNRGVVSSLMPMANLAFSLGLLAGGWYDIIKRMGQLRNKFAHIPSAKSFDDLMKMDTKNAGLLDSLIQRYKRFPGNESESIDDFRKFYQSLFFLMYNLIQFSIDHVSPLDKRHALEDHQV